MRKQNGTGSGLGIVGYDVYEFVVADIDRSRRFYNEMLDVPEVARLDDKVDILHHRIIGYLSKVNEGALTVAVASPPGITLAESDALGRQVEQSLLALPEVVSTSRRTGRAERDEHVQGINRSELEVVLPVSWFEKAGKAFFNSSTPSSVTSVP